ncbi:MAG: FKBP-type peptidyl-prolyl cis-trans isomerase [Bacteroidales bacterium]|nr:FKBP-type peptidyl-prolyl cis-trans isomerase [Bacteroidales bacterium]
MRKIMVFILAATLGLTACDKDDNDAAAQLEIDKEIIENYLSVNQLTAESTASGLYYIIDNQGDGVKPSISSTVTVSYTGKLLDGTVFDSGTASFPLTNVIVGWQEGIPLFNAGGTGQLIIPSCLAYGTQGSGSIPPNTVLIFDIYLISVK